MKKRTFLLLEILIAFFLVTVCAVPIVKQPLKMFLSEIAHLEKMEMERLADWTFSEIQEMLLKNEIPWEQIPEKKAQTGPFSLKPAIIDIPGCNPKKIERTFILKGRGEKNGLKKGTYRMLGITVYLGKEKFQYRLPVQRLSVE